MKNDQHTLNTHQKNTDTQQGKGDETSALNSFCCCLRSVFFIIIIISIFLGSHPSEPNADEAALSFQGTLGFLGATREGDTVHLESDRTRGEPPELSSEGSENLTNSFLSLPWDQTFFLWGFGIGVYVCVCVWGRRWGWGDFEEPSKRTRHSFLPEW